MGAISGATPNTFQSSIQQSESQNQSEVQQRREAQEALRSEGFAEAPSELGNNSRAQQETIGNTDENEQRNAPAPFQRVGGNIDISV